MRTVLYTGVTNDIVRRVQEHRSKENKGFTSRYNCYYLMYYEEYSDVRNAIAREKQLKRWHREWKLNLIRGQNPEMKDLAEEWLS
ncbi:GIY-YIG nuclease family protein [Niabella soli]|uniref:GIY-YIG nuclease family protein n=1 Tax=Niabella soli TaxID=446683 RepID=UPI0002499386|nr:GIY-YIG nuclease family protein [Niabella soli]